MGTLVVLEERRAAAKLDGGEKCVELLLIRLVPTSCSHVPWQTPE